jgi:hypothetical protein
MTRPIPLALQVSAAAFVLAIVAAIMVRGGALILFWALAGLAWLHFVADDLEDGE